MLGALDAQETAVAERSHRLTTATVERFPSNRDRGNFPTTVARRDFLAHTEFVAALETEEATAAAWLEALRNPVFMPYLGRRSCAPTFPFVLGLCDASVGDLFASLPHVNLYDDSSPLIGYAVHGDYDLHLAEEHPVYYRPETARDREGQLAWVKENLR